MDAAWIPDGQVWTGRSFCYQMTMCADVARPHHLTHIRPVPSHISHPIGIPQAQTRMKVWLLGDEVRRRGASRTATLSVPAATIEMLTQTQTVMTSASSSTQSTG